MGSVEAARQALSGSSYPQDRAVLAALGGGGTPARPAPAPPQEPDRGVLGSLANAARFVGQGATQALVSASQVNPLTYVVPGQRENLRRVEERHEQLKRDPEGVTENISYWAGRLAPEAIGSAGAVRGAAQVGLRGLGRAVAGNLPSALTFGADKESAIVQSDNPVLRVGGELAAGLAGEGLLRGVGAGIRALRGRGAAVARGVGTAALDELQALPLVQDVHAKSGKWPWDMTLREFREAAPKSDDLVDVTSIESYQKFDLTPVTQRRSPGYSIERDKLGTDLAVYRDAGNKIRGVLELFDIQTVRVDEAFERRGIGSGLYDFAKKQGFDVDRAMGRGGFTEAGAGLQWKRLKEMAKNAGVHPPASPTALSETLEKMGISEVEPGTFKITDYPGMKPQEYLNRFPGGRLTAAAQELAGKDTEQEFQAARGAIDELRAGAGRTSGEAGKVLEDQADKAEKLLKTAQFEHAASITDDFIRKEINVPKMTGGDATLEPELFQAVRDVYAEHGMDLKGYTSFKALREAADDMDIGDLLDKKAETLTAVQALTIRNMGNRLLRDKQSLAQIMGDLSHPPEEREAAKQMFEIASLKLNKAVVQQMVGGSADGRELAMRRIMGKASGDPLSWLAEARRTKGGRLNDLEEAKIHRLSEAYRNAKTPEEKKAAARALVDSVGELNANPIDQLMYVRKGSLLQVPVTHLSNIIGTLAEQPIKKVSNPPSWFFDQILGGWRGEQEVPWTFGRSTGIARRSKAGTGAGLKTGYRDAVDALRGNMDIESLSKMDLTKRVTFKHPITRLYAFVSTEIPFRALTAEDLAIRASALREAHIERAILIANKAGYKGQTAVAKVLDLLENPSDEMALAGIDAAELALARKTALKMANERTLRGQNIFTEAAADTRRAFDKGSKGIVGQGFLTFTSTPMNVAIQGFNSTPLGFLSGVGEIGGRALLKLVKSVQGKEHSWLPREQRRRLAEKMGRSTAMSPPFALGYWLASEGLLTGGYPATQSERDQWASDGKTPYSILWKGKWRRLERLQPFATPLVIAADVHRVLNDPDLDSMEKVLSASAAQAQFVSESPFFTGTKELFETGGNLMQRIPKTAARFAASFVPSAVRATAHGIDPTVREPEGIVQEVQARIPGMSQDLPARITNLGDEIKRDGGLLGQYFDVLRSSPDKTTSDSLLRAMQQIGATTAARDPRPGETPEQFETRTRREGQTIRSEMIRFINTSYFRRLSKDEKRREFMNETERLKGQLTEEAKR